MGISKGFILENGRGRIGFCTKISSYALHSVYDDLSLVHLKPVTQIFLRLSFYIRPWHEDLCFRVRLQHISFSRSVFFCCFSLSSATLSSWCDVFGFYRLIKCRCRKSSCVTCYTKAFSIFLQCLFPLCLWDRLFNLRFCL